MEVWTKLRKEDKQQLERIQGKVLRRIVGLPRTTPYWGLIIELGIWPVEWMLFYRRMMLYHNLESTGKERLALKVLEQQKRQEKTNNWYGELKEKAIEIGINVDEAKESKKSEWKRKVKKKMEEEIKTQAIKEMKERRKLRLLTSFGEKDYLREMNAEESRKVMEIRLNMVKVKDNYGKEGKCRLCDEEKETTEHVMECSGIPIEWRNKVKIEYLKSDDKERLQGLIEYYQKALELMERNAENEAEGEQLFTW